MSDYMFYILDVPNSSFGSENGFPDAQSSWSAHAFQEKNTELLPSGKHGFVTSRNGVQIATVR
jgi:hypothetical protein